jgi:hypothetical protein
MTRHEVQTALPFRFAHFRRSEWFLDFSLIVESQSFRIHRLLLAFLSPKFKRFLASHPTATSLSVPFSALHTEVFVSFIYGHPIDGDEASAIAISIFGCEFEIKVLKLIGSRELQGLVTCSNVVYLIRTLNQFRAWEISSTLLAYFVRTSTRPLSELSLLPMNLRQLFALPPFADYPMRRRVELIESVFGGRVAGLRPFEIAFLGSFINLDGPEGLDLLHRFPCDWVPSWQSRAAYSRLLDMRRAVPPMQIKGQNPAPLVLQGLSEMQFCAEIKSVNLGDFLVTLGGVLATPIDAAKFGLLKVASSGQMSALYGPQNAMTRGDRHWVSEVGSRERRPFFGIRFPAHVSVTRFVLTVDVKDAHGRMRPPPERMRCLARRGDDVVVIDGEIVFSGRKASAVCAGKVLPFEEIVFEMTEPPQSTHIWILRLSQVLVFGRFMP